MKNTRGTPVDDDSHPSQRHSAAFTACVVIDLTHAHIWDISSVASVDKAVIKFRKLGREVSLSGLNKASATIVDNLGVHQRANGDLLVGH